MDIIRTVTTTIQKNCSKKARKNILLLFLISTCIQNVSLINDPMPIKLVHVIGICLIPFSLLYPSKNKIGIFPVVMLSGVYIQTIVMYLIYGFNSWIVNMTFCALEIVIVWRLSDDFTLCDWLWVTQTGSLFVAVAVIVNAAFQWDKFYEFLAFFPAPKPLYESLFGGGPNLDASWLGLLTFLAANTFFWPPMLMLTAVFSVTVNSRVGILSAFGFLVWVTVQYIRKRTKRKISVSFWKSWTKRQKIICLATMAIIGIFFFATQALTVQISGSTSIASITSRFESIGNEPGSLGRINMWKWIPKELSENIWGYGLGNGMKRIRENDPNMILEDNLHNIYFQVLLDQGIVGFIIMLSIVAKFFLEEIRSLAQNPLAGFLVLYLFLGLMQYRLLETPMWFIFGAYLSNRAVEKRVIREQADTAEYL